MKVPRGKARVRPSKFDMSFVRVFALSFMRFIVYDFDHLFAGALVCAFVPSFDRLFFRAFCLPNCIPFTLPFLWLGPHNLKLMLLKTIAPFEMPLQTVASVQA